MTKENFMFVMDAFAQFNDEHYSSSKTCMVDIYMKSGHKHSVTYLDFKEFVDNSPSKTEELDNMILLTNRRELSLLFSKRMINLDIEDIEAISY